MQPVNLFHLAARQAQWLSVRQQAIASNIANANTPGYTAIDVKPFAAVLDHSSVAMAATEPDHFTTGSILADPVSMQKDDYKAALLPSHNTVVMEDQLMKEADVRRGFDLNTAIVKSFYGMMSAATKG